MATKKKTGPQRELPLFDQKNFRKRFSAAYNGIVEEEKAKFVKVFKIAMNEAGVTCTEKGLKKLGLDLFVDDPQDSPDLYVDSINIWDVPIKGPVDVLHSFKSLDFYSVFEFVTGSNKTEKQFRAYIRKLMDGFKIDEESEKEDRRKTYLMLKKEFEGK